MNLQHLKYAVEVERVGSITIAADNLYISQPSLSKAIQALESDLGFAVFERTSRGIFATQKGQSFLEHARAILKQMAKIDALSASDETEKQSLSLSAPRAAYVAAALVRFAACLNYQKPARIRIRETDPARTLESVADGSCRMGILRHAAADESRILDTLNRKRLKSEIVWEYEPVLLLGAGSRLAQLNPLAQDDLDPALEIKDDENTEIDPCLWINGRAMVADFLRSMPNAYMWSSPAPDIFLSREGLAQRPAPQPQPRMRDRLIYASDFHFSPSERVFIDKLYEVKNELAFGQ